MSQFTVLDSISGDLTEVLLDCSMEETSKKIVQSEQVLIYDSYTCEDAFVVETPDGPVRLTVCPSDEKHEIQESYDLDDFVGNEDDCSEPVEHTLIISPDEMEVVLPFIQSIQSR